MLNVESLQELFVAFLLNSNRAVKVCMFNDLIEYQKFKTTEALKKMSEIFTGNIYLI